MEEKNEIIIQHTSAGKRILNGLFATGTRRQPAGLLYKLFIPYTILIALYIIWANTIAVLDPFELSAIFTLAMIGALFIVIGSTPRAKDDYVPFYDILLALLSLTSCFYLIINIERFIIRIPGFDMLTGWDIFFGLIMLLLALEATRRTVGSGMMLIVIVFIAYNLWGHYAPGLFYHRPLPFVRFLDMIIFTTDGLFGIPVRVAATYAFLFVMFGTFLQISGGGDFYFNLAKSISGRKIGGPAKVAVTSSGLYGTLSGSPTSDVVTTGAVTIPMMIRLGYPRTFAAAVEVASATGGAMLPPVMGAAAFLLVELTGISYLTVCAAAVVPALLNFFAVYMQVHFRSLKLNLKGLSEDQIPALKGVFKEGGQFLIPLLVLTVALVLGYTPTYVAMVATVSVFAISFLRRDTAMFPSKLGQALSTTTYRMVPVTAATAAAGLIIGVISLTGLAGKVTRLIFAATGQDLFLTLFLTMIVCIILGMGMPVPAAYVMAAVLAVPALLELGIEPLSAHLFVLYFAVLSAITPPVAVAAYAASSIAEANPFSIALQAVRLSVVVFVIPYLFVYDPRLLLHGEVVTIIPAIITAVIGVYFLAAAVEGWLFSALGIIKRLILLVGGIVMMYPGVFNDIIGIVLVLLVFIPGYLGKRGIALPDGNLFQKKDI